MSHSDYFNTLICAVLTSFAGYIISRVLHAIWLLWTR